MRQPLARQLESIYSLTAGLVFLLAGVAIWFMTPSCWSFRPQIPEASGAGFLITNDRIVQVEVARPGVFYMSGAKLNTDDLPGALLRARQAPGKSRVAIRADRGIEFGRIKSILGSSRSAGYEGAILLTQRGPGLFTGP